MIAAVLGAEWEWVRGAEADVSCSPDAPASSLDSEDASSEASLGDAGVKGGAGMVEDLLDLRTGFEGTGSLIVGVCSASCDAIA